VALGPLGLIDLDDPPLSLADEAIMLAEEYLRIPSGDRAGGPLFLTPEQIEVLILWYQVTDDGRAYARNRGAIYGPKGYSKSPIGAIDTFFHLVGNSVPDGLDAYGRPVGRPHPAPHEQIASVSLDATDNLYGQFYKMLFESPAIDDFGIDLGITRTLLTGRPGEVEPVTAASQSRTGNPVTNIKREESWLWFESNGGMPLARTLNQNARKMRARILDLSNKWIPGTGSLGELTAKAAEGGKRPRTLIIDIGKDLPKVKNINDDREVLPKLRALYGSHVVEEGGWIDLREYLEDRPPGETTEAQWRQLYLNEEAEGDKDVLHAKVYEQLVDPTAVLKLGDTIALGFDGSDTGDATALYACRWPDWTVFKLGVWEHERHPVTGHLAKEWKVNRRHVKATIRATMKMYRVVRGYADPAYWQTDIDEFSGEFGERFMRFPHHSASRIGPACKRWTTMFDNQLLRFAPDEANTLTLHAANARKEMCGPAKSGWWRPVRKVEGVGHPIDAFSAAVSAVHALGDALAKDEVDEDQGDEDWAEVVGPD